MPSPLSKKVARRVMALARFASPPESREWTTAMAAELEYVDGSWKALSWSLGCFGVALKQRCISIFSPHSFAVETEVRMSKFAKISAVALVAASALFLFAPTFQQGLKLTAASWHRSDPAWLAEMENLAHKAEANHDSQALAFVAMQLNDDWEAGPTAKSRSLRDKFADEAVQANPQLTWLYYPLLSRDRWPYPPDAHDARWMARLQAWDTDNAAVYACEASFYWPHGITSLNAQSDRDLLASSPHWLSDMDKAFSQTEYDSYAARKTALDIEVLQRYGVNDPDRMLLGIAFYPIYESSKFDVYAENFLLKAGAGFEAKGDLRHAEEDYWKVWHMGTLIQLRDDNDIENMTAAGLQLAAGPPLERMFEKSGNASAASLVQYQTELAQQVKSRVRAKHIWAATGFHLLDAWVVQLSLVGMAISLPLILCCGVYFAARRVLGDSKKGGASRLFARCGFVGTAVLFTSAVAMYFGYAPYAAALQAYLAGSAPRDALTEFARFGVLQQLPAHLFLWLTGQAFRVYFWYTVIAVGAAIVAWILYRYLARTFRHSAPVPPSA
jgi:hypothetical protein